MNPFDPSRAFLDEVLAHPADDAPRLIYADFLEERGDPRGEFIRLQCELAKMPDLDLRYLDVSHRCDELLLEHRDAWAGELKQDVGKTEFSRGFIDTITIRARAFITDGDTLYQSTPVHWLRINYLKGVGRKLAATDALANVRFLNLAGLKIPEEDLKALLMSPNLSNLEALKLAHYDAEFSESVGATLAEMPAAANLRHLELPGGADFLRALSSGGGFPRLEFLAVGTNYSVGTTYAENSMQGLAKLRVPKLTRLKVRGAMTTADSEAVAALPIDQLNELDLEGTRIPAKGLQTFAERGAFDEIETLTLAGCDLKVRATDALFQTDQLRMCRRLNLSRNRNLRQGRNPDHFMQKLTGHQAFNSLERLHLGDLRPSDIPRIAAAEPLQHLEFLELESSQLGPEGLRTLAESPLGQSLRHLKLTGCDVAAAAIAKLKRGPVFPNLLRLDLGGGYEDFSNINVATVTEFMSSPALAKVQAVSLNFLYLRGSGLMAIAEQADLPELRQISYCHNHASRKSIDALMNSAGLPKLAKVWLSGTSGLTNKEKLIADYGSKVGF